MKVVAALSLVALWGIGSWHIGAATGWAIWSGVVWGLVGAVVFFAAAMVATS